MRRATSAQRRRRVPHAAHERRRATGSSTTLARRAVRARRARRSSSNHDGARVRTTTDGWRARLAEHVTVPVRWRTSMETLAGARRRRVRRGRPRLDDRRRRQAHRSRRSRSPVRHPRPNSRRYSHRDRPRTRTTPMTSPTSRHLDGERRCNVAERMIVAPGRRRLPPASASTTARRVCVRRRDRRRRRPGHADARCAARSAARSWACSRTPANACARVSRSRGCASRDRAAGLGIVGWGTAVPDGRGHERRPRSDASTRTTRGSSSAPASANAASPGPDETTATLGDRGRRATRSSAPGSSPADIDLLIVATATPEQPLPHTGAFIGDALGLQLRLVRHERRVRGLRLRARRRRVDGADGLRARAASSAPRR